MKSPSTNNFFRNNALPHITTTASGIATARIAFSLLLGSTNSSTHTTTKPPHRTTTIPANSTESQNENKKLKLMIDYLTNKSVGRDNTIASLTHRLQVAQINEQNSRNERINQAVGYQANEQRLLERVKQLEQEKAQLVEVMEKAAKEFDFLPGFASQLKEVKEAVTKK